MREPAEPRPWSARAAPVVGLLAGAAGLGAAWAAWRVAPVARELVRSGLLPAELGLRLRLHATFYVAALSLAAAGLAVSIARRLQRAPHAAPVPEAALFWVGLLLWASVRMAEPIAHALWGVDLRGLDDPRVWIASVAGPVSALLLCPLAIAARYRLRPPAAQAVVSGAFAAVVVALALALAWPSVHP